MRSISAALPAPPIADRRHRDGRAPPRRVRAFIAVFIPTAIQALSIVAVAKSISRPRGLSHHLLLLLRLPSSPPLFPLAWPPPRMAFCDRRLTSCAIDAATTSALVPASRPISRRDVLSFFFFPFFRPLLLPDDRFVTKLFTRKLKSSDGRKCGTATLMIF